MTTAEIFQVNQEINAKLADLVQLGDATIKATKHQEIMELVTRLCVDLADKNNSEVHKNFEVM